MFEHCLGFLFSLIPHGIREQLKMPYILWVKLTVAFSHPFSKHLKKLYFRARFWHHFAIMFHFIPWSIFECFCWMVFLLNLIGFGLKWDSLVASYWYIFLCLLDPVLQKCLWRFLGSFWFPFGSLLVAFWLFWIPFWVTTLLPKPSLSEPESVKQMQTTAGTPVKRMLPFQPRREKLPVGNLDLLRPRSRAGRFCVGPRWPWHIYLFLSG